MEINELLYYGMTLYLPPSFPSRTMSSFVIICACSRRGRKAVTLAPFNDASNASNTIPFARSPTAWTFYYHHQGQIGNSRNAISRHTTCQPSRKYFGMTSKRTSGSRRMNPCVVGLSAYGSWSWNLSRQQETFRFHGAKIYSQQHLQFGAPL